MAFRGIARSVANDESATVLMLPSATTHCNRSTVNVTLIYCLFTAVSIVLNKGVLSVYPHPNTVLLLQLVVSTGLARVLAEPRHKAGYEQLSRANGAVPLVVSFGVALLAGLHAFAEGVTVDQLTVFSTCIPIAVAVAEWRFLCGTAPDWLLYAGVFVLSAWAASIQSATLSSIGLLFLGVFVSCTTFYVIYASYYFQTATESSIKYVYSESSLACLPCLAVTLFCDWHKFFELLHLTKWPAILLALSCMASFATSYYSWEVRTTVATNTVGFATLSSCSGLISLAINYTAWDKHGPLTANWLTAVAVLVLALGQYTQRQTKSRHQRNGGKGHEVSPDPSAYAVGILAGAAAVLGLLLVGASLGASFTRNHHALFENSKQQFEQEVRFIGHEIATLKDKAVEWESNLVSQYTAVAGAGSTNSSSGSGSNSSTSDSKQPQDSSFDSRRAGEGLSSSSSGSARAVDSSQHSSKGSSSTAASSSSSTAPQPSSSNPSGAGTTSSGTSAAVAGKTPTSDYMQRLREAASKPINVVVMTGLFWTLDPKSAEGCSVDGIPLDCHVTQDVSQTSLDTADALYYHVPSFGGVPRPKAFPNQLRVAMSLESAVYYRNLDDPNFMCGFDAEMSYRHCAQVVNWYSLETFKHLFEEKPLPFEEKKHALVYINSNCGAQSGRSDILRALMKLNGSVPVHSLGNCDRNMAWPPGKPRKTDVQRGYKFCVTMENSISPDYVTEKIWDGLVAGCIPIYMGAPSALNMIPDASSVISYDPHGKGNASTPEELDKLMHEIGSDKQRYEAMLQWRFRKPEDQPSPLFRYLWSVQNTGGECFLCQFLARHRADPKPRYTTCLFNSTWMEANGRNATPVAGKDGACPPV